MPLEIVRNDIIKMKVDAIVNPSNSQLFANGGLDGLIHRIEGSKLNKETDKVKELLPGKVFLTKAYELASPYIIHTVGPIWKGGNDNEVETLTDCYHNSLALAKSNAFNSIAIPLISSGTFGFPKELALKVAVNEIKEFLNSNEMMIYLVVYDKESFQISESLFKSVKAYIDDEYVDANLLIRKNNQKSTFYQDAEPINYESEIYDELQSLKYSKKALEDVVLHLDESFSELLLRLIDERGLKDPEVYKKANVTKQTFSKIRNNNDYQPSKTTVIAFAIALKLNLDQAKDLLLKSGYALSKSSRFDVIISYFFETENYDIYEINQVLFAYEEKLLGV